MNRGDWQRLLHIQTYCRDIAKFIDRFGDSYETFTQDRAYFSAVSMCILQIGELANGLSDEFRDQTKAEVWPLVVRQYAPGKMNTWQLLYGIGIENRQRMAQSSSGRCLSLST